VGAAERLARQAQRAGVTRLVHVSGIGADARSRSRYIRSRGEGELAVRAAFGNAIVIRPAVMFGRDDAFLNTLVQLLKGSRLTLCLGGVWRGCSPSRLRMWPRPSHAPISNGDADIHHQISLDSELTFFTHVLRAC
jgi:uncharacterized protein YbjT (DUF2867 family)